MFSCEFCEISKNTFSVEHLWVTASNHTTEPIVSNNENRDGEVRSSAMQTKRAEKKRKEGIDCCLCGKCLPMLKVCAAVRKILG